jgi:hypothetical protein
MCKAGMLMVSLCCVLWTGQLCAETGVVSINSAGELANDTSAYIPGVSSDGSYFVFASMANNLSPLDLNNSFDVYLRDTLTGATELISMSDNGVSGNGWSSYPQVTDNGRYVVFFSDANDLIKRDKNSATDVFRYDRITGTMELISKSTSGVQSNGTSELPSVNSDGNLVAFVSYSTNLDASPNQGVFVRDVLNSITERVSIKSDGTPAFSANRVSISGDGNYVVFETIDSLVFEDGNLYSDVYMKDRVNNLTILVSGGGSIPHQNGGEMPRISRNGGYVVYRKNDDLMVRDLTTGILTNYGNYVPSNLDISNDGKVVFESARNDLIPGDTNGVNDVFLLNTTTGQLSIVSASSSGELGNAYSMAPQISADGFSIVFTSEATNLVPNDTNGKQDVFVRSY